MPLGETSPTATVPGKPLITDSTPGVRTPPSTGSWEKLQVKLNEKGLVDLDTWYLNSTHIRASRAAAGAKKGGLKP